ncbi:MAG: hypothetical protein VXW13_03290, partial [SAR324 cluster bacterium]|nr:hypothetical protein [SAR324 cluster bacterium]
MPRKVLLITADQFRFDHLGCTGHPLKPTPNLDRLAAESARGVVSGVGHVDTSADCLVGAAIRTVVKMDVIDSN